MGLADAAALLRQFLSKRGNKQEGMMRAVIGFLLPHKSSSFRLNRICMAHEARHKCHKGGKNR